MGLDKWDFQRSLLSSLVDAHTKCHAASVARRRSLCVLWRMKLLPVAGSSNMRRGGAASSRRLEKLNSVTCGSHPSPSRLAMLDRADSWWMATFFAARQAEGGCIGHGGRCDTGFNLTPPLPKHLAFDGSVQTWGGSLDPRRTTACVF